MTRQRLYIEGMEAVLANPDLEKILMSEEAARQAVPYLPLEAVRPAPQGPAEPQAPAKRVDPARTRGTNP